MIVEYEIDADRVQARTLARRAVLCDALAAASRVQPTRHTPAEPAETETGDAIFDVPPSVAQEIITAVNGGHASGIAMLFIGDYGVDLTEEVPTGSGSIHLMAA